jgi:hypothetical protein
VTKQLTTQNATITTAAVEVKTLTISGKQVTLAVFRQLKEEPLLATDGTLNGVPWGAVNYHPEKCAESHFSHWHIVWQHGTELRRARVDQIAPFDTGGRDQHGERCYRPRLYTSETANRVLDASVLEWLTGRRDTCPLHETGNKWIGSKWFQPESEYRSAHGFTILAQASSAALDAANARADLDSAKKAAHDANRQLAENRATGTKTWADDYGEGHLRKAQEQEEKYRLEAVQTHEALARQIQDSGISHSQLLKEHQAEVDAEAAWRQSYRATLSALAELPQLFIAV